MVVMTGGEAVVRCLESEGIEYVFGLCGHANLALLDALNDSSIKFIGVHHEQVAAHAADAYFRVTHKPAVVMTTVGPGVTNAITGVADAALDASAMVLFCGAIPSDYVGREALQELGLHGDDEQFEIYKPFTKRVVKVAQAHLLPHAVAKAFNFALTGCPGPVMVNVPMDFYSARQEFAIPEVTKRRPGATRTRGDRAAIVRAVTLLRQAEHPLMFAGGGVLLSEAWCELQALAEHLAIPVATSMSGQGAIPGDHPLAAGFTGSVGTPVSHALAQEADVVLAVGTRFPEMDTSSWRPEYFIKVPPATLIHVDINPHEIGRIYPTEVGMVGDARAVLAEMVEVARLQAPPVDWRNAPRTRDLARRRQEWLSQSEEHRHSDATPLVPERLLADLRRALPREGILVAGVGIRHAVGQHFPIYDPMTLLVASGFTTMGFEVAAALGAKIGRPDRPVVSLCGDGAFNSVISAIPTAVQYGIGAVWIVLNNGGYSSIELYQHRHYQRTLGTIFQIEAEGRPYSPDYVGLARAYGAQAERVAHPDQLSGALERALQAGKPYVLEVLMTNRPRIRATGHWDVNDILSPKQA
jgi:acetolactate synthase-1/2/3 large subunit